MSGRCTEAVVVAVIGAGASGTLTAMQLARTAASTGRRMEILLVDPDEIGEGLAYSTHDPRHRLNVPAKGMSAYPDDPDHFLRWLRSHIAVDYPPGGFAPRMRYAEYLDHCLSEALAAAPAIRLKHVRQRIADVSRLGRRLRLTMDDTTSTPVDAVVLATGHGAPSADWAPEPLRTSPRFVADPWRAGPVPQVHGGDAILLVGAGLTMIDMAQRWNRPGVRVHVTSRHGLLPLAHATAPQPPAAAPEIPNGAPSLAQLRRIVFRQIREHGDWRRAVDGLRPVTAQLWAQTTLETRSRFLVSAARRWDRVRHRIDPALDAWLAERRREGTLVVHAGQVTDAMPAPGGITVRLSDGTDETFAAVLNCTGTCVGIRRDDDPLVLNLLATGIALPGPLELGFATDSSGRVRSADGSEPAIWAVGPLRRGELWESTAIPEIRTQAAETARTVIAALPVQGLRRRARDPYGLPLTASDGAARAYVEGLGRILRVQSGAETLIAQACEQDEDFAVAHAALALVGVEWGAAVDVEQALARAERAAQRADERERRFVEVAAARVREPGPASAAALMSYIHSYPEDALAVSLAVPTIAFGGATEIPAEAWALVEALAPAYGSDWWYRGMLAFVRQDQERWDEAAELADSSLAQQPAAGHAVHARTHVYYETGRHAQGLAWLDEWIRDHGSRTSHGAHFSWHAALHELALGHDRAAMSRYETQLAPPSVSGVRALVDSASLLWRGYAAGAWTSLDVAPWLQSVPTALLTDPPTPFIALHAAVALAATGDCHGLAMLRRRAADRDELIFRETVAPLADALVDLVHGDAARATDALLALDGVDSLGGSAAQREVVQETLIHAAGRAGRPDVVRHVLQARLSRRHSPRDAARLTREMEKFACQ